MGNKIILEQKHAATGRRIFLVSAEDSHIQHMIKLARDPKLVELMGWNPCFELDQIELFIAAISEYTLPYSRNSQPLVLGICLAVDELPLGYTVLKGINPDLGTAEVGLAVLERQYRSKGYGRLGLQCTVSYAFEALHLNTIGA
ncbi:MAG: GNAT family N-acetyltransferase, partial [Leptolyngbya sp. SIO1D8]|nr:GNAT family N-acetyltransferase [Leptolyngbya sp. SIO1D8]